MGRRRPAMNSFVPASSAAQTSVPTQQYSIFQKKRRRGETEAARQRHRGSPRRVSSQGRGVTALMYACQQGDVDKVRRILKAQPFSLMQRDRTGKSPLHYCTTSDRITAAQAADLLVMAAPDLVEGRDDEGFTPLHLAVIAGNIQLVTFLLANKADVHAVDSERHTVVHWATVCGETEALRAVLAAGAPVSTPDIHGGYPLHYAAQMCGGDKESMLGLQVLHTLLSHSNITVTVEDGDRRQPLLWAASAGSAKAVLALVRAGAAVEASDKDGLTALHCAASRGHTDCIDTLLTLCGACPDVIDSNGCTALHYAVTLGHADATALLLAHGANANRQDRKGRSPAHCGCAKGQFETVKILGAHGANLWLRNARGDFPLHEAAASGRRDLVKWLLEMRPSQVNARNNDGRCSLHMAALHDNADMCKILLDAGAQVNPVLRTSKNIFMTPLDCALQRGFRSTAKFLQLHGGVPASKIANAQTTENVTSSANLNIRDDVTLWGDSSDDERENTEHTNADRKKRSYKKKFKKDDGGKQGRRIKMKGMTSDEVLRYSSEVIVSDDRNGTINIEQNGEIVLSDRQKEKQAFVKSKIPVVAADAKSEKRPKSAKRTKATLRSKTISSTEVEATTDGTTKPNKELEELGKVPTATTTSTQESTSVETVVEKEALKTQKTLEEVVPKIDLLMPQKAEGQLKEDADKQSLLSSTSIDEGDKEVVVEAHVHSPPKDTSVNEVKKEEESAGIEKVTADAKEATEALKESEDTIEVSKATSDEVAVKKPEGEQQKPAKQESAAELEAANEQKAEEATQLQKDEETKVETSTTETNEAAAAIASAIAETSAKEEDVETTLDAETKAESASRANSREGDKAKRLTKQATITVAPSGVLKDVADAVVAEEDEVKGIVEESITAAKEEVEQEVSSVGQEVAATLEAAKEEVVSATNNLKQEVVNAEEVVKDEVVARVADIKHEVDATKEEAIKDATTVTEDAKQEVVDEVKETTEGIVKAATTAAKAVTVAVPESKVQSLKSKTSSSEKEIVAQPNATGAVSKDGGRRRKPRAAVDETTKSRKAKPTKVALESQSAKKQFLKPKPLKPESQYDASVEMKSSEEESTSPSSSSKDNKKEHKSFRVLDDSEEPAVRRIRSKSQVRKVKPKVPLTKERSKSEESSRDHASHPRDSERYKRSKIPTPIRDLKPRLSKSDRYLDRVPVLSDLRQDSKHLRSESSMTAPIHASTYSDNERDSGSDMEELLSSATRRKRLKKRAKTRGSKSAGSDYESSNLIDSGFEPSPRSSRLPKWKNMSERGVDMTSVTQTIQTNIRRYHLERKIFQHLLELKRLQIRAGQHNEVILVKRAIDAYHKSCASTVGAGRYIPDDFTFKSFEKFLYQSLRKLQKNGGEHLKGLPESPEHPLLCTQSTNKCMHATHAYTGVPCAAYLPRMDHHTIPKIGFDDDCKPSGFLPHINQKSKGVTLELCHGSDKQLISLPADRLDQNKRYYVTFTVKGADGSSPEDETGHRHSKSD